MAGGIHHLQDIWNRQIKSFHEMVDRDKSYQSNNQDLISHLAIADQNVLTQETTIADQASEIGQLNREIFLNKALLDRARETSTQHRRHHYSKNASNV